MSNRQAVCKYFRQGKCQYGDNCRFYHPQQSGYGNFNNNGYGNTGFNNNGYNNSNNSKSFGGGFASTGFNNSNNSNNSSNNPPTTETVQQFCDPRSMNRKETELRTDMSELSEMIALSNHVFTSYSLKPPANVNLINRDFSYEEDRVQYYLATSTNSIPQYQQQINNRHADMNNSINFIKNNTQKAVRYLQLALQNPSTTPKPLLPPLDLNANQFSLKPTGSSIFEALGNAGSGPTATNPFGGQVASNPFGASSTISSGGAFGSSGFGSSSLTAGGGAFGSQTTGPSAFSSISNNNNTNNNTTGFSGSSFGSSPFGGAKPDGGAFGASGFGGSASTSNPFGASFNTVSNPFAGSSTTSDTNKPSPFGNTGFGSTAFGNPGFGSSGFGNNLSNSTTTSTPFGANATTVSGPFGNSNATATTINPFGASNTTLSSSNISSPFGTPAVQNNPFGGSVANNNNNNNNNSPLGNSTFQANTNQPPTFGVFGSSAAASNPFGGSSTMSATLRFKQCDMGDKQTKLEDIGDEIVAIFKAETFAIGKVPDIPPPLELC